MRILYVAAGTPVPGSHGGSTHALELCRALVRRGQEVHLVALPGDRTDPTIDGVQLHFLKRGLPVAQLEWATYRQVRKIGARLNPDVVVERFYTFGGTGLLTARALSVPGVLEINSPARPYPGSIRDRLDALTLVRPVDRWRRRMLGMAAAYYATSAHLLPPELQDKVRVVVNGVDCARFQPGNPRAASGPLRCVYVSSFKPWHGAEDLIGAVARCVRSGVDLRLDCVGEGPSLREARRLAAAEGVTAVVEFHGSVPRSRVPGLLATADVGVAPFSPARHRALELGWFWSPIKIFEYLAAELAVVTTETPEVAALLTPTCGLLYPAGDVDALAGCLRTLAADRERTRQMGREGREHVCSRYTWDHQARAVEEVLELAITGSEARTDGRR